MFQEPLSAPGGFGSSPFNGEDNADAHLKRQLMAHQVVLAIFFYAEFDGRRRKRVLLKAIGE
jgi:thiamine phosphate synthase YjbQ (UPF0047 family)